MSGEEILGQRRDIAGANYDRCDLCGEIFPTSQLREAGGRAEYAESDQPLRLCDGCAAGISRGELDVETLLNDDDDWRE